jgi:hypothetical protein
MIEGLNLDELREKNVARCEESYEGLARWTPLEWAGAMCGEAGEAANKAKKIRRMDSDYPAQQDRPDLMSALLNTHGKNRAQMVEALGLELGDVLIYADLLAAAVGLDLSDCVRVAFNTKSDEIGSPYRLSEDTQGMEALDNVS